MRGFADSAGGVAPDSKTSTGERRKRGTCRNVSDDSHVFDFSELMPCICAAPVSDICQHWFYFSERDESENASNSALSCVDRVQKGVVLPLCHVD